MNKMKRLWTEYLSSGLLPLIVLIITTLLFSILGFLICYTVGDRNTFLYSILNKAIILPILGMFAAFVYQVRKGLWKNAILNFLLLFFISLFVYGFMKAYSH